MNPCKIIVVDDDPIIRMDIREILEDGGYDVVAEGKNGEEAVALAFQHKPDLLIMDVKMPVMDGIKAAQIISKKYAPAILLLTAYSQKELVSEARNAGVSAYLVKPVTEEDLFPAVEIALSQKERMEALKTDIRALEQALENRKTIERAKGKLMALYAMDEEEAYQCLRRKSMSSRVPMETVARQILSAESGSLQGTGKSG